MIRTFAHPYMLFLLLPLAGLFALYFFRKRPGIMVPSLSVFRIAGGGTKRFQPRRMIPLLLYAAGAFLMVIAAAQPREGLEVIRRRAEGIDIIIALDLSGSMRAIDVPQGIRSGSVLSAALSSGKVKNRIDTAKEEVAKFINARPNDRIGLIAFAPQPYVVCPPTLDHSWLLANLERLQSGSIGEQTGLAGPIASAVQRLKNSDAKRRVVVLFTDGVNNVQTKLTPMQTAQLADTFNVTVYTVGIGSGNAVVPQKNFFGLSYLPVRGEFDEELLQKIAEKTGGVYYHAEDGKTMAEAMKQIDKLEKTSTEQQVMINWKEFYPTVILLALAMLCLGFLLEHTFCMVLP